MMKTLKHFIPLSAFLFCSVNIVLSQPVEDIDLNDPYLLESYSLEVLLEHYSIFELRHAIDAYQDRIPWIIKKKGLETDGSPAIRAAIQYAKEYLDLSVEEIYAVNNSLFEIEEVPEKALKAYEDGCRLLLQNLPPSQDLIEDVASLINETSTIENALYSEIYNDLLDNLNLENREALVNRKTEIHSRFSSTTQDYLIWAQHEPQDYLDIQIPACQRYGSPKDSSPPSNGSGFYTNEGGEWVEIHIDSEE